MAETVHIVADREQQTRFLFCDFSFTRGCNVSQNLSADFSKCAAFCSSSAPEFCCVSVVYVDTHGCGCKQMWRREDDFGSWSFSLHFILLKHDPSLSLELSKFWRLAGQPLWDPSVAAQLCSNPWINCRSPRFYSKHSYPLSHPRTLGLVFPNALQDAVLIAALM